MNRWLIVAVCATSLLILAVVGVVMHTRRQSAPPPNVQVVESTAEVRVKAVERKGETLDFSNVEAAKFLSKRPRRTSTEFGILLPETA